MIHQLRKFCIKYSSQKEKLQKFTRRKKKSANFFSINYKEYFHSQKGNYLHLNKFITIEEVKLSLFSDFRIQLFTNDNEHN